MRPHVTLTTDFGTRQGSQAVLHGVIYGICPEAAITDLTHEVTPFDVGEAGFLLAVNTPWFPAGTVHVAIVDPGVGTDRRPLALEVGGHRYVGPDNGVFSWVLHRADHAGIPWRGVQLNEPRYWLDHVSSTFHGRDLFAPVAAHLARGATLEQVGEPVVGVVRHPIPGATREGADVIGEVIYIDPFGSAICSVLPDDVAHLDGNYHVELCGATTERTVRTFGESDLGPDRLITLWDSSGYLLVTENNGVGGRVITPAPGDPVRVRPRPS